MRIRLDVGIRCSGVPSSKAFCKVRENDVDSVGLNLGNDVALEVVSGVLVRCGCDLLVGLEVCADVMNAGVVVPGVCARAYEGFVVVRRGGQK